MRVEDIMGLMRYYEVLVSSPRYHGRTALTYGSDIALSTGDIVKVPLQRQLVLGLVVKEAAKPAFTVKPIEKRITDIPLPRQLTRLLKWLADYYPAPSGQIMSLVVPSSLRQSSRKPVESAPAELSEPTTLPLLTKEQSDALSVIRNDARPTLLHGSTGSGKTRVYLELAADELAKGRSSILLTPEIGLTPQLAHAAEKAFPGRVIQLHSALTPAERRDRWLSILAADGPLIVVGPRSALFAPLKDVGLIVVDEAHDQAYKQEQAPHYVASRVAAVLAKLHGARLVLGTATPLVTDYYAFKNKGLPVVRMSGLAASAETPKQTDVRVVDLRDRSSFSRSSWLSDQLIERIEQALTRKEQSLVFLNRRGTARLVACENCGWQAACPRCDLPLTYHGDSHLMRCHTCGHNEPAPPACPECRSADITFKSIGTKSLVDELQRLLPRARIKRFDSDSKKSERLEEHYDALRGGDIDVLVGTQLLTKGLDLPSLTVVGIVVADTSLYFPDYTADERTFQMLTQVVGRVNRGHRAGSVILQTYQPDSGLIAAAAAGDYESFYEQQLSHRKTFRFPPFVYTLKVSAERAGRSSAEQASAKLLDQLEATGLALDISGPAPAFTEKVNNRYRWQIIVRSPRREKLTAALAALKGKFTYDIDPTDLL
jgi:primosomal protein N' (replication factor Y) (superfamily II helicase)